MKKITVLTAVLSFVFALGLCACSSSSLGVESDDTGVHAIAQGKAEGSASGNITIEEGYCLCINHLVEKGAFHIEIKGSDGTVVFDKDVDNNVLDLVDVEPGEYEVWITAKGATGTVDIIPGDKGAQEAAEAAMPEQIRQLVDHDKQMSEQSASAGSTDSSGNSESAEK